MRHHFKVFCLAGALALAPALAASVQAQVSQIDSVSAEAAIMNSGNRAAQVARLTHVPSVGVINLAFGHEFPMWENHSETTPQEFRVSAERNAAGIHKLQKALQANATTRRALQLHGVRVGSVVGVDISSQGSLRLYILR